MKPAWARLGKMSLLYRGVLFLAWLFFKCCYRHRVFGLEHFHSGPALIAANHTSFLDPPIVSISWPEEVHFLARETLFKNPLFGAFIQALNAHPVSGDAGDVSIFKEICRLLKEGKKIILFPEGKRSLKDELGPIKGGVSLLLTKTQSAIIPAYIHGTFEAWGRSRRFPLLFGKTACVFGSPILYQTFAHLEKKEAQMAITETLSQSIEALRKWFQDGAHGIPP